MDSVDGGYREELPDLPSSLPGLKRSAYLASQAQLDNLVHGSLISYQYSIIVLEGKLSER